MTEHKGIIVVESNDFSIGNAAGTARTMVDFEALLKTPATHITIGSIRVEKNEGNRGVTYFYDAKTGESGNALGVPDVLAMEGYKFLLPNMVRRARAAHKALCLSLHGRSPQEYARLANFGYTWGIAEDELNLSCPNERLASGPKVIPCNNPDLVREILKLRAIAVPHKKTKVKVGPVPNERIPDLVKEFINSGIVSHVVGINTVPNQTFTNPDGSPGLDYVGEDGKWHHTGGRGGKPIADERRRVQAGFMKHLPPSIGYVAVGGIGTAEDVYDCTEAGACGVQSATALLETKPFGRLFHEIAQRL